LSRLRTSTGPRTRGVGAGHVEARAAGLAKDDVGLVEVGVGRRGHGELELPAAFACGDDARAVVRERVGVGARRRLSERCV